MNASPPRSRPVGFSLIELLLVLAIIGIVAAMLLPALTQGQARARQIQCLTQLQEIGIAFHSFAHDHNGRFSMAVPAAAGGALELSESAYRLTSEFYFSYRYFQALANELVTPRLVVCPADQRSAATNFAAFRNENLSYFVGLNSEMAKPASILAGDRNITNDWIHPNSLLHLAPNQFIRWTSELHRFKGNLLFSDGHGELRAGASLAAAGGSPTAVADLLLPSVKPTAALAARGPSTGSLAASAQPPPALAPNRSEGEAKPAATQGPAQPTTIITSQRLLPGVSSTQEANPEDAKTGNQSVQSRTLAPATNSVANPSGSQPWFDPIVAETEQLIKDSLWAFYLPLLLLLAAMIIVRLYAGRRSRSKPLAQHTHES